MQAVGELHLDHVSIPFGGSERRYRHLDSRGNVGFTSDEAGAITSHRRYRPFGVDSVYGNDDFIEGEPRGFVRGVELRHGGFTTGLVALDARILDSDIGRFLSPDPVFQLSNQYTYALGNSVFYADSTGDTPVGVNVNSVIAASESTAARADAVAASQETLAARIAFAGVVLAFVGRFVPGVGDIAAGVGLVAAAAAIDAQLNTAEAAALRAAADAMRAAQVASELAPASGGGQSKELILTPMEEKGSGGAFSLPPSGPSAPPTVGVCGPPSTGEGELMTWSWMNIAMILLLGSVLFVRRKRPRDLHRAPPGQTAVHRWTRTVGIGLAFSSCFEVVAVLWRGQSTSQLSPTWILLGMLGLSLWFQFSEIKPGAIENAMERTPDRTTSS